MWRVLSFVMLCLILMSPPALAAMQWFSVGYFKYPDTQGPKAGTFDLAKAGVSSARYVKIIDAGKGASIDAVAATRHSGSDGYADDVLDFFAGDEGLAATMNAALGRPDYGRVKMSFAELGKGGWITLDMGAREEIIDGAGDDFEIISIGAADVIEVFISSGEAAGTGYRAKIETPAFGSLSIESSPGTVVYLDGKEIGETPRWIDNVRTGTHQITLKHSHDTFKDVISVEAGQVVKVRHSFLIKVPNVFRLSETSARKRLKEAGFRVSVKYTTNEEHPFGRVLSQSPKADKKVDVGSTVRITVNKEADY